MKTLIEASKKPYSTSAYVASFEEIQTGCMQRVADATELMATDYRTLVRERDMYKKQHDEQCDRSDRLWWSNNALRGVITRMKNKEVT